MDEVVGLIVEQLARRAREAKQRAAATPGAEGGPGARAVPDGNSPNVMRSPSTPTPVAPSPGAPSVSPAPGFDGGLGALPSLDAPDPFGGVGSAVAPAASSTETGVAAPLLADFAGGVAFLRAFVVSEALAPPVALREPKLP